MIISGSEIASFLLWCIVVFAAVSGLVFGMNLYRHSYRWREAWRDFWDGDFSRDLKKESDENAQTADRVRDAVSKKGWRKK